MLGLLGVTNQDLSLYAVLGTPLQPQLLGSQGMYGSLQGLIQSFNSAATCENYSGLVGTSSDTTIKNLTIATTTVENISNEYEKEGKNQMKHQAKNCDIDISGYCRSESSVYDVDSEDEDLDIVSSNPQDVQVIEDSFIPGA
ncbi:hypothetical protein C2845_PM05G26300 [Panicum miliaceum]|uniref:Uncharacterized protein n=1 Tax=Panicum miliaceum TaxID=4540 RepID=A0A3L6T1L6_PANMI|nr:hypothetical protein C2845_PM05G26300 [Panicum miliaceum]